jgi:hypothetical protein
VSQHRLEPVTSWIQIRNVNFRATWLRLTGPCSVKVKLWAWAIRCSGGQLHPCSALDRSEWSASQSDCLNSFKTASFAHWTWDWVGPRSGPNALDKKKKKKLSDTCRESNLQSSVAHPVKLISYDYITTKNQVSGEGSTYWRNKKCLHNFWRKTLKQRQLTVSSRDYGKIQRRSLRNMAWKFGPDSV